jgi:hypothetical protein
LDVQTKFRKAIGKGVGAFRNLDICEPNILEYHRFPVSVIRDTPA